MRISKIGFGTFDFGVPSLNIGVEEGARILVEAFKLGINFWDASDDYGSHPHIASALKQPPRKEVIISTKTYAKSGKEAQKSLKSSLKELQTDYVDIFLLHYVKSDWIDGCHQTLREMKELKTSGVVKAIGISTHSVKVAEKAANFEDLDVLMAVCTKISQATIDKFPKYIPLEDGTMNGMFNALKIAHENGKGTIAMKVLGNGLPSLVRNHEKVIKIVAELEFVDAMVIGMKNLEEVRKNLKAFT
ncbi:MAG: aldo/keto reductase [Candidatus Bathyarchaeota archaeon]|nr:aldo/keto reductase [Candidatus Bathyarchaeota archaeon]